MAQIREIELVFDKAYSDIPLAPAGEHLATRLRVHCQSVLDRWPDAIFSAKLLRADGKMYVADAGKPPDAGGRWVYDLAAADVCVPGPLSLELSALSGATRVIGASYRFEVIPGLWDGLPTPEEPTWVERVVEAGRDAAVSAQQAGQSAKQAAASATQAGQLVASFTQEEAQRQESEQLRRALYQQVRWEQSTGAWKGEKGDKGDKGDRGEALGLLDAYETLAALEAAHPVGGPGQSYLVGTAEPLFVYVWSQRQGAWISAGTLAGMQGEKGEKGDAGAAGESAYVSALRGGYERLEGDFYQDLAAVSEKVPLTRTVNAKPLAGDIVLTPGDVGAVGRSASFAANNLVAFDAGGNAKDSGVPYGQVLLSAQAKGPNLIPWGDFTANPFQRTAPTPMAVASGTYFADQWFAAPSAGTMNIAKVDYGVFLQWSNSTGATVGIQTRLEDPGYALRRGGQATVSIRGVALNRIISVGLSYLGGTGIYSPGTLSGNTKTFVLNVPDTGTTPTLALSIMLDQTLSADQRAIQLWDVKLEQGSCATGFIRHSPKEVQDACARYYQSLGTYKVHTNYLYQTFPFYAPMRITPTVSITSMNGTVGSVSRWNTGAWEDIPATAEATDATKYHLTVNEQGKNYIIAWRATANAQL